MAGAARSARLVGDGDGGRADPGVFPGWKTLALVLAFYAACVAFATYPRVWHLGSALPDKVDPVQHLGIMRWYKTCLQEGRSPLHCPDIQYPLGAPLGNFSPLHFQSLLYLPLSMIVHDDVVCYNLIWLSGFLLTGLGTFALAWSALRDRACSAFAGMLAMLSAPLMLHAHGHLELQHVGWFPLFLVGWARFVDRPARGRMLAAASLYLLVAMSAAYFALFAVMPAVLYVAWRGVPAIRRRDRAWLRSRAAWLAAFAVTVGPGMALLFSGQVWAMANGLSMARPRGEFHRYGAPLWGYVVPTSLHGAGQLLPFDLFEATGRGPSLIECGSYLGLVTILLMLYAAVHRVGFPRAGFYWATFGMLVLLSCGAFWMVGRTRVDLPAGWLWRHLFAFRMIRVPARFNLFAGVCAGLLAAAGLRHLLARLPGPRLKAATYVGLVVLAVADLAMVPFGSVELPPMPACYAAVLRQDPQATFVDAPMFGSGGCHSLNASCGYWQAFHRGRTTGGYSGFDSADFDDQLFHNSPFSVFKLIDPGYLGDPDDVSFGIAAHARFDDYAWLYLTAHRLRYVVLHQGPNAVVDFPVRLERLKARLGPAKVYEDDAAVVYDRARLRPPARPTLLPTEGWHPFLGRPGPAACAVSRVGRLIVFNPDPDRELRLTLDAAAFRAARSVRLSADDRELALWDVAPDETRTYRSPPFRLPAGLHALTIESDGQERPRRLEAPRETDLRPYSLQVVGVSLEPSDPIETSSPAVARRPERLD